MGKIIKKQIQGMHWWSKISLVLILTLVTTVFAGEGWFNPTTVQASVSRLDTWPATPQINNVTTSPRTASFSPSAGSNRIVLISVQAHTNNTTTTSITGTYGGSTTRPLRAIVNSANAQRRQVWLFYLNESDLSAVNGTTLTITNNNPGSGYNVYVSTYSGVDQTSPITASTSAYPGLVSTVNVSLSAVANGYALFADVHSTNSVPTNDASYTSYSSDLVGASYAFAADGPTSGNINVTFTYPAAAYNGWAAVTLNPYVVTDSTPPSAGTVTVSPDISGTYTSPAPTITTIFTDAESAVSSCQYTTNGSTWLAGTVSGTGPNYTCTANPTGLTGFLNINMRATSAGGGPTTATQIQRTVDTSVPTDGTLTVTSGNAQNNLSWTAAVDTGGSGIANYILRYATGATPPASCAVGTAVTGSPFSAATLSTTHTGLANGTQYSYRLCATDNLGNTSGGVTGSATPVAGPISNITSCNGCHGYTTTFADGTARNVPVGQFQGSHNNHVISDGIVCSTCHVAPATTTSADFNHANGTLAMASPINGDAGATYSKGSSIAITNAAFSGGTCSSTKCHGTISPAWGNNTNNNVCTKCHGTPTAGTPTPVQIAPTAPATAAHNVHLAGSTIGMLVVCTECHENVVTTSTPGHMDGIKTIQFNGPIGTAQSTVPSGSYPATCGTVWCHGGNTTSIPQNKPTARTAPVWGTTFGTTSVLGDALGATSVNTGSGRCAKCHGFPPATASHAGVSLAGAKPCNGCHTNLKTDGTFVDPTLHVNGIIEGGSCTGCHASIQGKRVASAAQFTGAGNSHHFQSTTAIDGKTCYACHWEADATGSPTAWHKNSVSGSPVALVVWNGTTRPTGTPTSATLQYYSSGGAAASTRGAIAKINRVCIGCHNATNAATQPFSAGGDTNTPVKYAWDGLSIDARYSNTGTTPWGKFSGNDTNAKSGQTKAYSAHGNAVNNPMGWSTVADTFPSSKATSNVMCFDCHNSHGSTTASVANAVTSSYSSATGRRKGGILKDVTAGYGGYTITYEPAAGGLAANKNAYNSGAGLCFDCHMTATATATIPWGFTGTFGFALPAGQTAGTGISGYFDTPFFGLGTFASTATYPYKASHGASVGGHLGASSALTTAITKRAFDPATPTGTVIQGLCTPCHDPHGVSSSLGTNQQYGVPLLKGTWVTSPYKQDAAPANTNENRGGSNGPKSTQAVMAVGSTPYYFIDQRVLQAASTGKPTTAKYWNLATNATTLQTTNDTQFAGLCTGCHAKSVLASTAAASSTTWKSMTRIHNSVKGWAAATGTGGNLNNKVHAYTCSKCHTPHNYRLPRLLVTNCLDVKHRGRVASGGNMAASNTGSSASGAGAGRFPGGGGGANGRSSATNPGPWFFGVSNGTSNTVPAVPACHASATAGGSAFTTAGQLWNTKSPW